MRAQPFRRSRRLPRVTRPARGLLAAVVLVLVGVLAACSAPTGGAESSADTSPTSSAGSSPAPSSPAPAAQVTPAPTGHASGLSIRVDGNKLVDGAGRPVVLRGVNVSGTEFACMQGGDQHSRGWSITGDQPLTDVATYAGVAAWGANVVRVPLNELCWLGLNGVNPKFGGDAYRQVIHAQVNAIHAAGLYAVLDLHWSAPGNYAAVAQQPMADADHSVDFWKSVAGEFRDDPAVLFDLFNEPYMYWTAPGSPDQWTCWLHGCELTQFVSAGQTGPDGHKTDYTTGLTWRSAGMQDLVDAVRETGAKQALIVKGLDWGNDLSGWKAHQPKDPLQQLVAGWHSYPGQPCGVRSCWEDVIRPLSSSVPVVATETGDHVAAPVSFLPDFLKWADGHGVGYLAWTWNVWDHPDNVLVTDWHGQRPTPGEGTFFRDHLLGLRQLRPR